MVTFSQTREKAIGSMHTFLENTDQAEKNPVATTDSRLVSLALIVLGALFIALGPWLSGDVQTLGSWCRHGASISAQGLLQDVIWMATKHCAYCYLGAAIIGVGIATGLRRTH